MTEMLRPFADKGMIKGALEGNHERRVYDRTGVNVTKMICKELKIRFLGDACWNLFKVGDLSYAVYTFHGRTGARFDGTALLALERISPSFAGDAVWMGHAHKQIHSYAVIQYVKANQVIEQKKLLLVTGGYLSYDNSYAQTAGLPISKLGSPRVIFNTSHKDIQITW
jgi:hypothetical protein